MKLEKKEWVAVVVALFVVGFFFVFGPSLISLFTNQMNIVNTQKPEILAKDLIIGVGKEALVGDRIIVHYTGRFVDGRTFDSSVGRGEPFQFILGGGQVIEGWDKGLVGMREGGKRILSVPPELGYGMNDYGPIPGGSTLMFEVELLKVDK